MDERVPEDVIDYDEVYRRGGANLIDEDFALFRCPNCGRVYLLEYEVDTVYVDPDDLSKRVPVSDQQFVCVACGQSVPGDEPWVGKEAPLPFHVTWRDLSTSGWRWAVRWPEDRG